MGNDCRIESVESTNKIKNQFGEKYKEEPKKKSEEREKNGEFVALLRKKYEEKEQDR